MRLPPMPPRSPKHTEERLKLAASGLQTFALALFVGVLLVPSFNASIVLSLNAQLAVFLTAGSAEAFAFVLLRYIPPQAQTEPPHA